MKNWISIEMFFINLFLFFHELREGKRANVWEKANTQEEDALRHWKTAPKAAVHCWRGYEIAEFGQFLWGEELGGHCPVHGDAQREAVQGEVDEIPLSEHQQQSLVRGWGQAACEEDRGDGAEVGQDIEVLQQ